MLNLNELILDRVRKVTVHDISTGELKYMINQIEEPSIKCGSEGEEVVDAIGTPITTLYRAKTAVFTASNSLFHFGLLADQLGSTKEIASETNKVLQRRFEILEIVDGKVTLKDVPSEDIPYIYSYVNSGAGESYKAGSTATAKEFKQNGKEITTPTGLTGKVFVEYTYETSEAIKIENKTDGYPEAVSLNIYARFKDVCNENIVYSGTIHADRAKVNAEDVEIALTTGGKHAFEFKMFKNYCDEDCGLFTVVVDTEK